MCDDRVKNITSVKPLKDIKKLKKLREQDPELYNLKKYGSKKVYSILCQNQRQPLIYTAEEVKSLSGAEMKRLTKYWNFTMNKDAYYGCPNKKYPHLSFIVNVHPKHYCLPCCKKSLSTEESKKTRVNTICLQDHKFTVAEGAEVASSRHIMNYGKDIDIGRISKLPNTSIKGLLYNSLPDDALNYYLFGVAQHFPAVKNVGIIYCVAEALHTSAGELMHKVITDLKKAGGERSSNLFNTLLNGTLIEYFDSFQSLIAMLEDIFVRLKFVSLEMQRFKQWSELFMELFHLLYKITIFTFIDETGKGETVDLYISNNIHSEINYIKRLADTTNKADPLIQSIIGAQKYILVIRKHNRYYPIFAINAESYFKTYNIDMRTFSYTDNIVKILHSMVTFESKSQSVKVDQIHDLSLIKEFADKLEYRLVAKYVNKQNLCYAVLIEPRNAPRKVGEKSKSFIYVPIDYSVHIPDKICVKFEAFDRAKYHLEYSLLEKFISDFNGFIKTNYALGDQLYTYALLKMNKYLRLKSDGIIGVEMDNRMIFYFNSYDQAQLSDKMLINDISYDYGEINRLILERSGPIEDNRTRLLGESLYNNYIYQLLILEFINFLEKERNTEIRAKIRALIMETNFKKDISEFQGEIRELLKDFPADYSILQNQLLSYYYTHFSKNILLEQIDTAVYDFDHITINNLRKLGRSELIAELKQIVKTFSIEKKFDTTAIKFPNIYLPCDHLNSGDVLDKDITKTRNEDVGFCEGKKLLVNANMDELINILANDIKDDLKVRYLMSNMFSDTVVNFLSFNQYPTEIITIYKLDL